TNTYASSTYFSFDTASTTFLNIGGDSFLDLTGADLSVVGNALTVDTLPNLTGTLDINSGGTNASTYANNTLLFYDGTSFVSTSTHPLYVGRIIATSTAGASELLYASSTSLTSSSFSNFGGLISTASSTFVTTADVRGDLSFHGEIQPDGATCADNEILKKAGANNWDCAADQSGTGSAFPFDATTYGGNTVNSTSTTLWLRDITQYGMIASTTLTQWASTTQLTVGTLFTPETNDGVALGSASLSFSDLFLASGGVINWANGDVTLTHSAGDLSLSASDRLTFPYSSSTIYSSFITASTTNLVVNNESFNDLTGSGLSLSSGALTVSNVPVTSLSALPINSI
ncbi:MAG: hypothetical protein AAB946_00225, partial [Patescibacteria group bacterium]